MKLWLDDVRPAPDASWTWVKTVEEAKRALLENEVTEASLDHDLGYVADPNATTDPRDPEVIPWNAGVSVPWIEDGIDLVRWMCEEGVFPTELVTIHSWNPVGAREMFRAFMSVRCPVPVLLKPFELPSDAQVFVVEGEGA